MQETKRRRNAYVLTPHTGSVTATVVGESPTTASENRGKMACVSFPHRLPIPGHDYNGTHKLHINAETPQTVHPDRLQPTPKPAGPTATTKPGALNGQKSPRPAHPKGFLETVVPATWTAAIELAASNGRAMLKKS